MQCGTCKIYLHSFILISHRLPEKPNGQSHLKLPSVFTQIPPCSHGLPFSSPVEVSKICCVSLKGMAINLILVNKRYTYIHLYRLSNLHLCSLSDKSRRPNHWLDSRNKWHSHDTDSKHNHLLIDKVNRSSLSDKGT